MTDNTIRVLHPITRMIVGGAQETAMLTAELMDKSRWTVHVICGPQIGPEGSLIEETRQRGVRLDIEPALVREVHPFKDVAALIRLIGHIRRGGYTIVHTNSSKAGILGRWAARLAGVPLILHTVHGWGHHERQRAVVRAFYILLEKMTLPITDRLIAVSPLNVEKGLEAGIGGPADYVVIRSGIELERFGHPQQPPQEIRAALDIPAQATVVGTVTRLSPQKAPLDFVRAVALIGQDRPETRFVIVGDGPLRPQVEALIAELGLADRLILTGLRRDVPELMAAFDIFVLSSLWEGLPRVLPQAMATGLPIVATAIDGNAEAVQDGVNGYLTPPGNPEALAQAIIQLVDDDRLRARMGQAGRRMAPEFGAQKMVDDIAALYTELLAEKGIAVE